MRFSFFGLLLMQPFEDEQEAAQSEKVFETQWHIVALAVLSALFCISGIVMTFLSEQTTARNLILISLGILAINAGFQWQQGLKARALNHLYSAMIVVLLMMSYPMH